MAIFAGVFVEISNQRHMLYACVPKNPSWHTSENVTRLGSRSDGGASVDHGGSLHLE